MCTNTYDGLITDCTLISTHSSSIVCEEIFDKTLPHLAATELGVTVAVQPVNSSLRTQMTRRFIGHKDAIQGRLLAFRDSKSEDICDEKMNRG
jgi:hypothetical protein